jgi:creatinine amidohydrolase/Fe(II)-dependent formamide hydrolase-like protein
MLAINEEYVREDRVDFVPEYPRPALDMYSFKTITPEGVWGTPSKAAKEKGEKYIKLNTKYTAQAIIEWLERCKENSEY